MFFFRKQTVPVHTFHHCSDASTNWMSKVERRVGAGLNLPLDLTLWGMLRSANAASILYSSYAESLWFVPPGWGGSCVVAISDHPTVQQPAWPPVTWNNVPEILTIREAHRSAEPLWFWGCTWGWPGTSPCKWVLGKWFGQLNPALSGSLEPT